MSTGYRQLEGYLVVKQAGWTKLLSRWVAKRPTRLEKGEVPIRIILDVPLSMFAEPPCMTVRGTVDEGAGAESISAILRTAGLNVVVLSERVAAEEGALDD